MNEVLKEIWVIVTHYSNEKYYIHNIFIIPSQHIIGGKLLLVLI